MDEFQGWFQRVHREIRKVIVGYSTSSTTSDGDPGKDMSLSRVRDWETKLFTHERRSAPAVRAESSSRRIVDAGRYRRPKVARKNEAGDKFLTSAVRSSEHHPLRTSQTCTPKTQSRFSSEQEETVTVGKQTYKLEQPLECWRH